MITVALSHLLDRGVRLNVGEALAVAQLAAIAPGRPAVDNVEISSDGSVVCMNRSGEASVSALAVLLHALLPHDGVAAPLRYAVARGMGAVTAPAYASVAEFSHALRRFEAGERSQIIRDLLARAARSAPQPALPVAVSAAAAAARPDTATRRVPAARPRVAAETAPAVSVGADPAGAVELRRASVAPLTPTRSRGRLSRLSLVAAALLLSGGAGFAAVALRGSPVTTQAAAEWIARVPATWMSRVPSIWRPRVAPARRAPETKPPQPSLSESAPRVRASAAAPPRVALSPRPKTMVPVRALPAGAEPAFSPAFSASGTAIFFQTGGTHDRSSAIEVASASGWPADDLRIMKVVDNGARNYHAQPSPDGRLIAFDSDRDGERGVYVANSDGSNVRRLSGPGYAALPTWSPDGRRLAYVRAEAHRPSVWNLWIQPLDDGAARRVTDYRVGQTWSASWFPDGRRIAYSHEDTLTILDLDSGGSRQFATPLPGRLVRTPAVSPDGSRVVFQVFRAGAWLLNVEDGTMECVLSDPTAEEFAWAPDGHRFAFHSRRDGQWSVYVLSGLGAAH